MNPEISIIVPIYQVEKYIYDCMVSICNQTFKNFEVILVNDGSKDKSLDIAISILEKNKINFKVIEQKNMGQSVARNEGLKKAVGEWVVCIDSDDVITSDFLKY